MADVERPRRRKAANPSVSLPARSLLYGLRVNEYVASIPTEVEKM